MPLAQLFAFYAASAARNGVELHGPNYLERDVLARRRARKKGAR